VTIRQLPSRQAGVENRRVVVDGIGLHSGAPVRVVLEAREGPVALRQRGIEAPVAELSVVRSSRCTSVEAHGGALRVATVEHALAALAGLRIRRGVVLHVEGPEMPLLDGGALAWCEAWIASAWSPARLPFASPARYPRGRRQPLRPRAGDRCEVEVRVEFDGLAIEPEARWDGSARDFRGRIAPHAPSLSRASCRAWATVASRATRRRTPWSSWLPTGRSGRDGRFRRTSRRATSCST